MTSRQNCKTPVPTVYDTSTGPGTVHTAKWMTSKKESWTGLPLFLVRSIDSHRALWRWRGSGRGSSVSRNKWSRAARTEAPRVDAAEWWSSRAEWKDQTDRTPAKLESPVWGQLAASEKATDLIHARLFENVKRVRRDVRRLQEQLVEEAEVEGNHLGHLETVHSQKSRLELRASGTLI